MKADTSDHTNWCERVLTEALLAPHLADQFQKGSLSRSILDPIASRIKQISDRYVAHAPGNTLASPIRDGLDAEAYALYYTPINFAKIRSTLENLGPEFWDGERSILDFGAGPGTATLAAYSLAKSSIQSTLIESSAYMNRVSEKILSSVSSTEKSIFFSHVLDLRGEFEKRYDLIVAANVLTELKDDVVSKVLYEFTQKLTERGALLLLEPGQQLQTRRLMKMRDDLLRKDKQLTPLFPCPHTSDCPMLRNSDSDWCHGTLRWERPKLVMALDALTGFNKHRIKYSAILVQRNAKLRTGYRLLTNPEKNRRGLSVTVCGTNYYGPLLAPKRIPEENFRALRRAEQWDLVKINGMQATGELGEMDVVVKGDAV